MLNELEWENVVCKKEQSENNNNYKNRKGNGKDSMHEEDVN